MEQDITLWAWILWLLKVLILAALIGIPFLVIVVLVSQAVYNKFAKRIEKSLEDKYKQKGFTLIEVLVVLIILGLIAAIIVPRITGRVDEAKIETTKIQLKAIKDALEQYKLDNGMYPTTEQGLKALVEKPTTPPEPPRWRKYLDKVPKDGWDRDFIYISPGVNHPYELRSKGPDGEEGTEDDIDVWNL
ncbi:type II secretion system protein G (GspG) [Hydrogenivirga caldilitoris]|uniref:Type II secretion system core protein G n=1 Tax=Hydrogenivirga caldilitoris TaxID=246264 RepID=A0A497XRU4_9AQUI|nr:type II secretion system protein G (GspG) [Hydrogenivirga caldilitoris]